jgi:hypothetical protein
MADQASVTIKRTNPSELGVPPGYSQVVEIRGGRIIFIAGQTALDRNGEVVGGSNFSEQRRGHSTTWILPSNLLALRSQESIFCHGEPARRSGRDISGGVTPLWSGFPDRNRGNRGSVIVASSIAAKKPFAGDFVGTLRECDCVFSTLEERESPAVT